jgi:16S rRNA (uracil1498-N3)-methyltransferase
MDAVVRQATELGATRIVPVTASRGVARLDGRVERWRAIAEDAIRVSGRPRRPVIEEVVPLASVFGRARARVALCLAGSARSSVGAAVGDGQGLRDGYEVLIGPEGGLDPEEIAAAAAAGFSQVQLGPYTLRTETAGPAVLAILQYVAGALDPTDQES